jgi:quercetin dioxygenase-like cupin family protein
MTDEQDETFTAVVPHDIRWKPFDAFPSSVHLAILVGHPGESGPFVARVKAAQGARLYPHAHRQDRVYTVIQGPFYLGRGATFDGEKLVEFPTGSVIVVPKDTPHFHCARGGEYIVQMTAVGTIDFHFVDGHVTAEKAT